MARRIKLILNCSEAHNYWSSGKSIVTARLRGGGDGDGDDDAVTSVRESYLFSRRAC